MSQEYVFEFSGSKEHFLYLLNRTKKSNYGWGEHYFFDDHIVEIIDGELRFGVGRAGHSGGYWFIPTVTEYDGRLEFRGMIEYKGPENESKLSPAKKILKGIEYAVLFILILPFLLIFYLYSFICWLIDKMRKKEKIKVKTPKENLCDLMENYFHCVKK